MNTIQSPHPSATSPDRTAGSRRAVACVLGEIDLVRALAAEGIRSAVMAEQRSPARWSRHSHEVLPWVDPWRETETAVARLLEYAAEQPEPPVLFYDGDWELLLVSRHRERLRPSLRFVVPDAELVEDLVDKARFQALAERLELPVPAGRVVSAGDELPRDLGLRFPVVAKPVTRQHVLWRPLVAAKAVRAESHDELARAWPTLSQAAEALMVQELVPGPESRIESYHVYIDDSGSVAGEFTGRKLRTHPPEYGYTTALEITGADDVAAEGRDIVERIGLRGVAKLDFKRSDDGRLHLIEINPRFTLWNNPGARAGMNLPALVYADLTGTPRPATAMRPGVCWCNLVHDLDAARKGGLGLRRWLAWVARCETTYPSTLTDPMPLLVPAILRTLRRR